MGDRMNKVYGIRMKDGGWYMSHGYSCLNTNDGPLPHKAFASVADAVDCLHSLGQSERLGDNAEGAVVVEMTMREVTQC